MLLNQLSREYTNFKKLSIPLIYVGQKNGETYVIKITNVKDVHTKDRVTKEIKILYDLTKDGCIDNIICYTNAYMILTYAILVTKFINGNDLIDIIYDLTDLSQCINICKQIAYVIKYIHDKRIIHRDIKLDNIRYDNGKIILLDFGYACYEDECLNDIRGTLNYIAPEVLTKNIKNHKATDIYSLGITFYTILSKQYPYPDDQSYTKSVIDVTIKPTILNINNHDNIPNIDTLLIPLIMTMISKNPSTRPTIDEVIDVLNRF